MLDDMRAAMHRHLACAGERLSVSQQSAKGSLQRVGDAWTRIDGAERLRLRNHATAIAAAAAASLLTMAAGLAPAGPLILADVVIAAAAWFGGFSTGLVAALTVVLVGRLGGLLEAGVPVYGWLAVLAGAKGLVIAGVVAAVASRATADNEELDDRERRVDRLCGELRRLQDELTATRTASAVTQAAMSRETDVARTQLTTLQSITDPSLNTLQGAELVTTLLDRLRSALAADGVALCSIEGRTGRIFSASDGVAPLGTVKRTPAEFREYQTRRTSLVHNDPSRVADDSLCGWPPDVTSLISVPVFQRGRLQLVVEVANCHGRRSTEWELALIQVVAERAAGLIRPESYGAVA
jgi:hypothetical protein